MLLKMPISRDEFEKYKNPFHRITEFLEKNKGTAFTLEEIAESIRIEKHAIAWLLEFLPLVELMAMSKGIQPQIQSVKIKNVTYYRYNEKYIK